MKNESEIIEQLKSNYHFSLKDVPEELRTEKVCINALKYSFANSINYVPNDILSESFLSKRIRSTKKAIEVVKNVNDAFLRFIPSSLKNSDVCIASVIANPNNFKYFSYTKVYVRKCIHTYIHIYLQFTSLLHRIKLEGHVQVIFFILKDINLIKYQEE